MLSTLLLIPLLFTRSPTDTVNRTRPVAPLTALRSARPITIDGRLTEAVWQGPPMVTEFIQSSPDEGKPATEHTEVRIAVDDEALYVAAHLSDHAAAPVSADRCNSLRP